jgi:hypothetical protein
MSSGLFEIRDRYHQSAARSQIPALLRQACSPWPRLRPPRPSTMIPTANRLRPPHSGTKEPRSLQGSKGHRQRLLARLLFASYLTPPQRVRLYTQGELMSNSKHYDRHYASWCLILTSRFDVLLRYCPPVGFTAAAIIIPHVRAAPLPRSLDTASV